MMYASTLLASLSLATSLAVPHPNDSLRVARAAAAGRADSAAATRARAALAPASVDSIVIEKRARRLILFVGDSAARIYRVALGNNPVGPKRVQGDGRTPEGLYVIDRRNPQSKFYRSLHISYPNAVDRWLAAEQGLTAGGEVMVHGLSPAYAAQYGAEHVKWDWTEGCVALTNAQIDEMWNAVADGTRIRILP